MLTLDISAEKYHLFMFKQTNIKVKLKGEGSKFRCSGNPE